MSYKEKKEVTTFNCSRCGHKWIPRNPEKEPTACPGCHSPYWKKPRTRKTASQRD